MKGFCRSGPVARLLRVAAAETAKELILRTRSGRCPAQFVSIGGL
jgi:hypothetical protein